MNMEEENSIHYEEELNFLVDEKEKLLNRIEYLQQPVDSFDDHPHVVYSLNNIREDLPNVSREAPEGFTSMYDHLLNLEKKLTENPQQVILDEINRVQDSISKIDSRIERLSESIKGEQ